MPAPRASKGKHLGRPEIVPLGGCRLDCLSVSNDVIADLDALIADRHPIGTRDHLLHGGVWLVAERADYPVRTVVA
jgi:hypothetical protein